MSGKEKEAVWEESTFLFATIFCSKQLSDPDLASELQASLSGCDINSCLPSTLLFQSPLCWDNGGSTSKNRGYLNPHLRAAFWSLSTWSVFLQRIPPSIRQVPCYSFGYGQGIC